MTYEWEHPDFGSEPITYTLECRTPGMIGLDNGDGHQQVLGLAGRVHELYRVGTWMVESRRDGDQYFVRLRWLDAARKDLQITFERGSADINLTAELKAPKRRKLQGVTLLELRPGKAVRVTDQTQSSPDTQVSRDTTAREPVLSAPAGVTTAQVKAAQEALAKTRRELQDCRSELSREKERRQSLEQVAAVRLEELAALIETQSGELSGEIQSQLARVRELETRKAQLARDVEAGRQRLAAIQSELDGLQAELDRGAELEEVRSLNCKDAQGKVAALRRRRSEDEGTLRLMQEASLSGGTTVAELLEQARKTLDRAEDRIGRIIRVQEKLGQIRQHAILSGDGTVPLRDERGGEDLGDGTEPETTDP